MLSWIEDLISLFVAIFLGGVVVIVIGVVMASVFGDMTGAVSVGIAGVFYIIMLIGVVVGMIKRDLAAVGSEQQ
jgi:hypothetical protein